MEQSNALSASPEVIATIDAAIRRLERQCARLRYQWEHGLRPTGLSEPEIDPAMGTEEVRGRAGQPSSLVCASEAA